MQGMQEESQNEATRNGHGSADEDLAESGTGGTGSSKGSASISVHADPVNHETGEYEGAPLPPDEAERVRMIDALKATDRASSPRLKRITSLCARMLNAQSAMLSIVQSSEQRFHSVVGFNGFTTSRRSAFCAWTFLPDAPRVLVVPDTLQDQRFKENPLVVGAPYIRFYAGAPLIVHGTRLGTLCVLDGSPRPGGMAQWQVKLLISLARLVSDELSKEPSSDYLANALESCFEGFVMLNPSEDNCTIKYVNEGWTALTGYSRSESVGQTLQELLRMSNESTVREKIESKEKLSSLTVHCSCKNEEKKSFKLSLCPVEGELRATSFSEHSSRIYIIVALLDITENVHLRQEASKRLDDARAAEERKNSFLANVSHAVRTPLNAIISGSNLVLENSHLGRESEDLVRMMKRAGKQLLSLINDIMEFSRLDSQDMPMRRDWFELSDCIDMCVEMTGQRANEKGLMLTYNVETNVPVMLYQDETRIRQVLVNLVSNAIKFTDEGEVEITVSRVKRSDPPPSVSVAQPEDSSMEPCLLRFSVRDTGKGVSERDRPKLFRYFSQAEHGLRDHTGTGLGLAICASIVRQTGGTINFSSKENEGSTFTFTIWGCCERQKRSLSLRPKQPGREVLATSKPVYVIGSHKSFQRAVASLCRGLSIRYECKDGKFLSRFVRNEANISEAAAFIIDRDNFEVPGASNQRQARYEVSNRLIQLVQRSKETVPLLMYTFDSSAHISDCVHVQSKPITLKLLRETLGPYIAHVDPVSSSGDSLHKQADHMELGRKELKILVAEDNMMNRKVLQKMLCSLSQEAVFVDDGEQALEYIRNMPHDNPCDLIFMDLQMPRKDGIATTKSIREDIPTAQQPVIIALTADVTPHVPPLCQDAGMNGYMSKPVRKDTVSKALDEVNKWKERGRDEEELFTKLKWIQINDLSGQSEVDAQHNKDERVSGENITKAVRKQDSLSLPSSPS